jgi:hypothetical protein
VKKGMALRLGEEGVACIGGFLFCMEEVNLLILTARIALVLLLFSGSVSYTR